MYPPLDTIFVPLVSELQRTVQSAPFTVYVVAFAPGQFGVMRVGVAVAVDDSVDDASMEGEDGTVDEDGIGVELGDAVGDNL